MFHTLTVKLRNRPAGEILRLLVLNVAQAMRKLSLADRRARRQEKAFDRRWGTDTIRGVSVRELGFTSEQMDRCHRYDASSDAMVHGPIAMLDIDPARFHFIDYGAGKGRALMLALQIGFAHVTGVELSAQLCAIAEANLAIFAACNPSYPTVDVVSADATAYRPEGEHLLAYFYNPFGPEIMTAVRQRLEAAHHDDGSDTYVLYANPEFGHVFAADGWRELPAPMGVSAFRYMPAARSGSGKEW